MEFEFVVQTHSRASIPSLDRVDLSSKEMGEDHQPCQKVSMALGLKRESYFYLYSVATCNYTGMINVSIYFRHS